MVAKAKSTRKTAKKVAKKVVKKAEIAKIKGHTVSVCEDVPEHYAYWRENVNRKATDCCNLRR